MQFTQEEAKALLVLLNRVQLSGQEAETFVHLKRRIGENTLKEEVKEVKKDK